MGLVFVTGGSRGLGKQVAKELAERSHQVVIFGSNSDLVASTSSEINCTGRVVDLGNLDKTKEVFTNALAEFGTPEILIQAAAVMSAPMSKTLNVTSEEWRRVMTINLDAVLTITQIVGEKMAANRNGRIIIFSACMGRMSDVGNTGGFAPYRISKSGVNALVRNFAHETSHGRRGLFVDAICPGHCRTDMGGASAPKSIAEGAETAVWLATRELQPGITVTGRLWEDREVLPW
jgi:NAD(P)-dependent dehydrogenase (short-subunit alcohol dehydrogenase family)